MDMDALTREARRWLLFGWDDAYKFAHDPGQREPFSATRRDESATVLRAATPGGLRELVTTDYAGNPVTRRYARDRSV